MVLKILQSFMNGLGKLNNLELNISQKNTKTYHEYSFKIKIINWRLKNHELLTHAARYFGISDNHNGKD